MTRDEHVKWCKDRALEYVERGDLDQAVASMVSDMGKRDDCTVSPHLAMIGMMDVMSGDTAKVRKFIEGFR